MINEIKDYLNKGVKAGAYPGAAFCLVENGEIRCDAVGYKALEPDKLVNDVHTIYDVASLTKVVSTTTLIMHLIETKQLSLDAKVYRLLKRYKHQGTTIDELLTHTSGLPADIPRANTLRHKEDVLSKVYDMELSYEPKTKVVYSDVGFILLGQIIETLFKQPIHKVAHTLIFNPLNMTNTTYRPDKDETAPTEYRDDAVFKGMLKGLVHDEKSFALEGLSGHAGLFSTAYDLALFAKAILDDAFVLNAKTIQTLMKTQVHLKTQHDSIASRALGWDKPTKGGMAGDFISIDDTIMHTGFTGCHMIIEKKQQKALIVLSNGVHPKRQNNQMMHYRKALSNIIFKPNI